MTFNGCTALIMRLSELTTEFERRLTHRPTISGRDLSSGTLLSGSCILAGVPLYCCCCYYYYYYYISYRAFWVIPAQWKRSVLVICKLQLLLLLLLLPPLLLLLVLLPLLLHVVESLWPFQSSGSGLFWSSGRCRGRRFAFWITQDMGP